MVNEPLVWHIEKRKVADLKNWDENPRTITPEAFEKLKDRIRKRGFHDVVKIDIDDTILSGNQRKRALLDLNIEEVATIVPNRKLTEEERIAVALESNREDGTWNWDQMANFDEEILKEVGFKTDELDRIFLGEDYEDEYDGEKEHDEIKEAKTKRGELYSLGKHRLLCGDSIDPKDMAKLMGEDQADMVFCDPPYNMNYKSKKKGGIIGDHQTEEKFIEFAIEFTARMKENLKAGGVFYMCSGYSSYVPFLYALKTNNLEFANPIIWVKNQLGMGMNDYRHSHEMIVKGKGAKKKAEPILYGWNQGKHYFVDVHNEGDVWEIKKRATNTMVHPTQKPIEMICRAIRNSSKRDDIILDQFGGSGSTLIAAEKEGRRAYLMELDPKYADVILNRFHKFTGIEPKKLDSIKA
jgi:DNA modification methylase